MTVSVSTPGTRPVRVNGGRLLKHMELLWVRNGMKLPLGLPPEIGALLKVGAAFAGTAGNFKTFIQNQIEATGANYFVCDVAFGDLALEESMQTVELIAGEIMPFFTKEDAAPPEIASKARA